jgi:hypothetical protein
MSRSAGFKTPQITKDRIGNSLKGNKNVVKMRRAASSHFILRWESCPKCGSTLLGEDEDGQYCLCGWHNYGEPLPFLASEAAEKRESRNRQIGEDFLGGKTRGELSAKYHLSKPSISDILKGIR